MSTPLRLYPRGTVYQLLVSRDRLPHIMDEWLDTCRQADIRVRKAKTPGCAVVETEDVEYAYRLLRLYGAKVAVKVP